MAIKPGKRQLKAEQNKQRIFECAIKLFNTYGFKNVSVEDIVRESGASIGSFYHYFKCKEQIPSLYLTNFLRDSFLEYENRLLNDKTDKPILDKIKDFLFFAQGLPHTYGEEFLRIAMLYMINEDSDSKYNFIVHESRPYIRICKLLIEEGQASGELRTDKTSGELAKMISVFQNGLDEEAFISGDEIDIIEQYGDLIEDFLKRILSK